MEHIVIGFSKHKGFAPISWLIRLVEHTDFSHAYVRIRAESLSRDLVYQATGSGVYFVGKEMFDSSAQVVEEYEVPVTSEDRVKLLQWAVDNAGKPYGKKQMLGLALVRFARLFGFKIKNPFVDGNNSYVCCELAAAALKHLGFPGTDELDQMDLLDLRDMVRNIIDENQKA